ncbi:MAG: hypothetical protein KDC18_09020 [Alphaproteobacteria bacterium]|nr:hypothetical protein [Alphaproteobacteria bacterium]MCB9928370.1 hypothetical protein [Alphaproteobacteria bacterium]
MTRNTDVARGVIQSKSVGLAFLLTFLFGPLGLLYVSIPWGIVLSLAALILGFVTFGVATGVIWLISIIWAVIAANRHNERLIEGL